MNKKQITAFSIICLLFSLNFNLAAQDTLRGSVKYQKITRYNFKTTDNTRWNDYIATLPSEGNDAFVLYFTAESALYTDNPAEQGQDNPRLQGALMRQNWGKPPKPNLQKVYYNFEKQEKTEQVVFMTRYFLIDSDMETKGWKLTNQQKMILGYIAMSAELQVDDQKIIAWFTPQIPVSLEPAEYYGLPGLILAVETNGLTTYLATSAELTSPAPGVLIKSDEGKKVSQKLFEKIMEEKIKEAKENKVMHRRR